MKLISFILVICRILSLVSAQCVCDPIVPNCDQLPRCGKAILRNVNSCKEKRNEIKIAECNEIHFSKNLKNDLKCPDGTKAWPLMFIWEVTYDLAAPDGVERYVYKINNRFPPPTIHAIKGDWVLIPVINNIKKPVKGKENEFVPELTTIHWHGITMRIVERENHTIVPGTPFMDGVPGINQCAIPGYNNQGKNRLDYFFQFVDSGTYWYHSHYEMQIADGLAGPIIVKDCDDINRVKNLNDNGLTYDEEDDWDKNIIAFNDWFHKDPNNKDTTNNTAEEAFETYRYSTTVSRIKDPKDPKIAYNIPFEPQPNSGLINGVGGTNLATFHFVKGKTYRLRLINMSAMALFTFQIEKHTFEVIEVEGMLVKRNNNVRDKSFTELTINSGQRYSILVNANQENGFYWMRLYSKGCHRIPEFNQEIVGVVLYDNVEPPTSKPDALDVDTSCTDLPMNALIPYCDDTTYKTYTLFCGRPPPRDGYIYNMTIILDTWPFNISKIDDKDPWNQNVVGYLSPGLKGPYWDHKWSNIKNNTFLEVLKLNKTSKPKRWDTTLNIYNLNETKVHDIFFNNIDPLEHPIHLHGHFFYVLGFGYNFTGDFPDYSLNEINPIQRDTITVPPRGWAQVRFVVDNPGVWPMHCHIDWHVGVGMLAQFVELGRSDVAKIYTEDNNKPPKEWCEACTDTEDAKSYCAK